MKSEFDIHISQAEPKYFKNSGSDIDGLIQEIIMELMEFTAKELTTFKDECMAALKQRGIARDFITYCGKIVDAVSEYKDREYSSLYPGGAGQNT